MANTKEAKPVAFKYTNCDREKQMQEKFSNSIVRPSLEVSGSYLVKLEESQEGKLQTKYTLTAEQEKGKQIEPAEVFEKGNAIDKPKLRAKFASLEEAKAGQASTLTITFEEAVEFI